MHMADALLSPGVGGTFLAVSGALVCGSALKVRNTFDEKKIALMGMAGAFVFAGQMINFAIPGTGSSGHIAGAILLSALLGSAPAFIVMTGVLLIQALFFADGGLLALGCNIFNMAFFGCFLAYPYIFKPLAGGKDCKLGRLMLGSCAACVVSLELGALAVTIETLASGITSLPFGVFAAAMMPIHIAIGLGEGLATGAVLIFVRRNMPETDVMQPDAPKASRLNMAWVFGLAALVIGGGLSLIASGKPDGLEWSIGKVTGAEEVESGGGAVYDLAQRIVDFLAILPDYSFKGSDSWFGTTFSGIVGAAVCALLVGGAAWLLCRRKKSTQA